MRMMASIIYLIFGLSLTSMCINVVQAKLSDSFRQASAKIGATIGLTLAEEEARSSQNLTPVPESLSVHSYGVKIDSNDNNKTVIEPGVYDNAEIRDGKIVPDNSKTERKISEKREAPPIPSDKNKTDVNKDKRTNN